MLSDMFKSKLTSLAMHGCCRSAGGLGKHLRFPIPGDANSLRERLGRIGLRQVGHAQENKKVPI